MKKLLLITTLFLTTLLYSCSDGYTEEDYANYYTYATAELSDSYEVGYVTFTTDAGEELYISENKTKIDLTSLTMGNRYVLGVRVSDSAYPDYDYATTLYSVNAVINGSYAEIASEAANEQIPDDKFYDGNSVVNLTEEYLNLHLLFSSTNIKDFKIILANNSVSTPKETQDGYANLELRLDNGNKDEDKDEEISSYQGYVSFKIDGNLEALLDGKDGIILRINETYGDKYYTIPFVE